MTGKAMKFILPVGLALLLGSAFFNTVGSDTPEESGEKAQPARVSDAELQIYIDVYQAMQDDHDLAIEEALAPRQVGLAEFRRLELRIQKAPALVARVRKALLEHAKSRGADPETSPSLPAAEKTGGP